MPDGRQRREHLMSEYVAASTATAAAAAAAAAEPSSSSGASDSSAPLRGGDASRSDTREAAAGLGLRAAGKGGGRKRGSWKRGEARPDQENGMEEEEEAALPLHRRRISRWIFPCRPLRRPPCAPRRRGARRPATRLPAEAAAAPPRRWLTRKWGWTGRRRPAGTTRSSACNAPEPHRALGCAYVRPPSLLPPNPLLLSTLKVTREEARAIRSGGFPVLVAHGRADRIAHVSHAARLARRLRARWLPLRGAHMVQVG